MMSSIKNLQDAFDAMREKVQEIPWIYYYQGTVPGVQFVERDILAYSPVERLRIDQGLFRLRNASLRSKVDQSGYSLTGTYGRMVIPKVVRERHREANAYFRHFEQNEDAPATLESMHKVEELAEEAGYLYSFRADKVKNWWQAPYEREVPFTIMFDANDPILRGGYYQVCDPLLPNEWPQFERLEDAVQMLDESVDRFKRRFPGRVFGEPIRV